MDAWLIILVAYDVTKNYCNRIFPVYLVGQQTAGMLVYEVETVFCDLFYKIN
jgi:hypothetical protein